MDQTERERYGRHILLGPIGEAGQQRLLDARVLVVGLGGLGSPVAMYLAASGVGTLVLADYDRVELSNLQRQIAHGTPDVGRDKVESAAGCLGRLNPGVRVETLPYALDADDLEEVVGRVDLVADCTDNFATRFALNVACFRTGTPLVSGAAVRFEGQVTVFDPRREDSPCYRCLYGDEGGPEAEPCSRVGVLAPLVGMIGSMQAVETLKVLTGAGEPLVGRVVVVDGLDMDLRTLRLRRDPACPVCSVRKGVAGSAA
ncbi:MAG: molybdopterin-synthase adenylyltransferase MoeB [Ectothiorhodospiraceae bacterium]|nr:molybdopterin-synthase adenylyltransferase MoeB [Chromatiales bacterium]MCP5154782.1 molybdopterin-synthase adenylyltransferase MoeB [Ectothiorhodospiraceae bacterium]